MTGIEVEPARFAMTGTNIGCTGWRYEFSDADMQAIDAPEFIAAGSVYAGHITSEGKVYASTSLLLRDRIRWVVAL